MLMPSIFRENLFDDFFTPFYYGTCVGTFPYMSEGEMLEVSGEYTNHNVYGMQLQVISHEVKEPEDLISIERYLGCLLYTSDWASCP